MNESIREAVKLLAKAGWNSTFGPVAPEDIEDEDKEVGVPDTERRVLGFVMELERAIGEALDELNAEGGR